MPMEPIQNMELIPLYITCWFGSVSTIFIILQIIESKTTNIKLEYYLTSALFIRKIIFVSSGTPAQNLLSNSQLIVRISYWFQYNK